MVNAVSVACDALPVGMGLALVRSTVAVNGGKIDAETISDSVLLFCLTDNEAAGPRIWRRPAFKRSRPTRKSLIARTADIENPTASGPS